MAFQALEVAVLVPAGARVFFVAFVRFDDAAKVGAVAVALEVPRANAQDSADGVVDGVQAAFMASPATA